MMSSHISMVAHMCLNARPFKECMYFYNKINILIKKNTNKHGKHLLCDIGKRYVCLNGKYIKIAFTFITPPWQYLVRFWRLCMYALMLNLSIIVCNFHT